jgi:oligopeptide/dipeptide ABC transporter ATP-binding protein
VKRVFYIHRGEEPLLQICQLHIEASFRQTQKNIVGGLSFEVEPGERLGIVGESGCGKTMTALAVFGLLPSNCNAGGRVYLDRRELLSLSEGERNRLRGTKMAYVPQNGMDFLNPSLTVRTHLYETLKRTGAPKKLWRERSLALLRQTGFSAAAVEEVLRKYPFQLSGGMAQRVVLAMGIAASPVLVTADEPTRGIDHESAMEFMALLENLFPRSAVIIITHDISVASTCTRLLVMLGGKMMEYGPARELLTEPKHPYTQNLLAALPERGFAALPPLAREVPGGCPFYSRCTRSRTLCAETPPPEQSRGPRRWSCHDA